MRRVLPLLCLCLLPGCWLTSAEIQERLDADTAAGDDDDDDDDDDATTSRKSRRVEAPSTGDSGDSGGSGSRR